MSIQESTLGYMYTNKYQSIVDAQQLQRRDNRGVGKGITRGVENGHSICTARCKKKGNNKAEIKRRIQVARVRTLPRRLSCIDAEQTTDSCRSRADGFAGGRRRDLRPVEAHVKLVAFFLLKTWPPGNPFGEE